jgi:hypothetical protein
MNHDVRRAIVRDRSSIRKDTVPHERLLWPPAISEKMGSAAEAIGRIASPLLFQIEEDGVSSNIDDLLPPAKEFMKKLAAAEFEESSKEAKKQALAEAERQALLDHFKKPSGVSDEEGIKRALKMIERAVGNGQSEIQVYRFPAQLCTDRGRAINQQERGWETTLTGVPKEIFQLWDKYFKSRGYKLRTEIVSFPNGMPGDIAMTLAWG